MKKTIKEKRQYQNDEKSPQELIDYFFAAASSKLFAACVTYPHEVLRTRLRENSNHDGLINTFKKIAKIEGAAGLYGGMTAHLLRVVPNSAIMFLCYESIVHFMK